jgi:hypothetical protein
MVIHLKWIAHGMLALTLVTFKNEEIKMITLAYKQGTRCAVANACSVVVCLITLAAAPVVQSNPFEDIADIEHDNPTMHEHDHANKTWPPTPEGTKNIKPKSTAAAQKLQAAKESRQKSDIEKPLKVRSEVSRALGKRFNKPTLIEDEPKDGSEKESHLVYFSHEKNSTVDVVTKGNARKFNRVKTIPAKDYQPEITDEEIAAAEKIARAYYASKGISRVEQLKAFGILAYKPEGKGFYDARVIYISFHLDSDSLPEYVAWVDLTNQAVIREQKEQL